MKVTPGSIPLPQLHGYLQGAVAPRPIAFASTVDKSGSVNLSPFSYFNIFGSNPPILIFSPSRRGRDNTVKHTYQNVLEVPEVVINMVSYDIVEQMSLSSTEYDKGVDEFIKSGLTAAASDLITPPRVKESPVSFECKVNEVKPLGKEGGAGNLVIAEILLMHISDEILTDGKIDPQKIRLVGRMGGNWYSKAYGDEIFEIDKPLTKKGIGVDQIPEGIRLSNVLTGNDLGRLGNVESLPSKEEIASFAKEGEVKKVLDQKADQQQHLHKLAQKYLAEGAVDKAWLVLLQDNLG